MLRPFAIGLCILFFPTVVLGTINSIMSPVVQGTDVYKRQLEHGEETVVFLLAETDGVSEHRRIEFGISPAFVSFFFTHITLRCV